MDTHDTIVVTGAAGLVGQNLIGELSELGFTNITAIDKHQNNLSVLQRLRPTVHCVCADLSIAGSWEQELEKATTLFLLQAQITGATYEPFERNTLKSTANVLAQAQKFHIPYTVFVGSSVVNSCADDNYTRSKKAQEALIRASVLDYCIVRPTLMFGWFDPKHLGWLSRFMEKIPIFPIPGDGRFARQPLYVRDFCRVLIRCAEMRPSRAIYDIVGEEEVNYIDIIRVIKNVKGLHTAIVHLPVWFFRLLMQVYGAVVHNPPFVVDQLDALMAGDHFSGAPMRETFNVIPTPFHKAIEETFTHPKYSKVVLERWT